jgi:hypothetical protein
MMQVPKPRGADASQKEESRLAGIAVLVGLAALTLAFFWKIALTNRVLAGLDVFAYFYPYRDFVGSVLRSGQLPLWNPYLFMGAPLLANSQAAVLYPLNWLLIWLSAPKQIAWSIVLHIWLAGAGTYLFGRKAMRLSPLASFAAATVFAFGGFLDAQAEHVNQLDASAWLPWLLLCMNGTQNWERRSWLPLLSGGAVVGLILLAGHTQAAYIVLFGAALYALFQALGGSRGFNGQAALKGLAALALMAAPGGALAAGQLWPTLELSGLSVRSGGLPYNEAASFSLKPGLIFKAFLPPLLWDPPFSEYIAYVGVVGLVLAAIGAWAALRRKAPGRPALLLAISGVFLAFGAYNPIYYLLYKLVPGFDLFRVPARWLLLYSFGLALVAGAGLQSLVTLKRWRWGLVLLLGIELFAAGQRLAYNNPTAPVAFDSLRTAPAHLLADGSGQPFRFLSMSDLTYDPGDLGDLQAMYQADLSEPAIYDLIVATKMKEVLAYNLPLRYRLFSVDGYDGGLLPIRNYVTLEHLFLPDSEIWPDGRLRQQLRQIPSNRLLSLLNVKYVITDKAQDAWIDDVFYDLEHTVPLGEVTLADLPDFETTQLGVVSYLTDTQDVVDGTPVAEVVISSSQAPPVTLTLCAGRDTAEGLYETSSVAHQRARVGHPWRDNPLGNDYLTVLDLGETMRPTAITVRSLLPSERFDLRGLSLIDDRNGTSRSLTIDPDYRLVHSGDVKIYQNLTVLPRSFVVYASEVVADDEEALAQMQDPAFDPARQVILAEGEALPGQGDSSTVDLLVYRPEEVQAHAVLDSLGYLVLTDTYYPGWVATVDGKSEPIARADLYFRAVKLEAGDHLVTFRFEPASVRQGLGISLTAGLVWGVAMITAVARIGRKRSSSV